jgi:hypothetical protein
LTAETYGELRLAWERCIEEVLFNEAVQRCGATSSSSGASKLQPPGNSDIAHRQLKWLRIRNQSKRRFAFLARQ